MKFNKIIFFLFCFPAIAGKCQNVVVTDKIPIIPIESIDWKSFVGKHNMYKAVKFEYDNFGGWNTSSRYSEKLYDLQYKFIGLIIEYYTRQKNALRVKQWKSILNFFYWMYKRSLVLAHNKYTNVIEDHKQFSYFMSVRDSIMAELFFNDYNDRPNNKAIALMSNYHALKNPSIIEEFHNCCMGSGVKTLGEIINKRIGAKLYNMCFVSASGERGIHIFSSKKRRIKIPDPIPNSLESGLKPLPIRHCIVNLKHKVLNDSSFYMNVVFDRYLKSKWSEDFDGIFFIKKMEPLIFKNFQF